MKQATFRIWRGASGGEFKDYTAEVVPGMVVLDAIHQIQASQAGDLACRWNCKAGKCGSCSAEINGKPRLMCMTRLNDLPLEEPVTVEPMKAFPPIRDLVTDVSWNYARQKDDQAVQAEKARRAGRNLANVAGGRRSRPGIPQVHRVLSLPGRLPRPSRAPEHDEFHRPAFYWFTRPRSKCIHSTTKTEIPTSKPDSVGFCNITHCRTQVCPERL